jgi:aminoglycoside 6'-N-acetyltransferase I
MIKAGLQFEGVLRQSEHNNQGICDSAHYAILAEDYFKKPQTKITAQPAYRQADVSDIETVTDLLCELYHTHTRDELLEENKTHLLDGRQAFFLVFVENYPIGIAHAALRSEYVNGTEFDGTIGYLEGIYVQPEYRMNHVAAALVYMCENWARSHGCREFASDCLLENTDSYNFHRRIGFEETERCIFFRKEL